MNFGFTEEQEFLRQEARKFLDDHCPTEAVRKIAETEEGFSRELWAKIAELGWVGLTIPEEHGGAGLGWVDGVVLLEETGRSLFPSPLISTTLAASAIREAGTVDQQKRWLPSLADGSSIGTLAIQEETDSLAPDAFRLRGKPEKDGFVLSGDKLFVPDLGAAERIIVLFRTGSGPEELSLAMLDRSARGVKISDLPCMDQTKRLGRLTLEGVRVDADALLGLPGAAWPTVTLLLDLGACAVAAETIGAAEASLELTVQYAKERIQFDTLIGRFQGVKHPLAEMYTDVESFKSLVYYAAWALDEGLPEASLAVSRAKAYATEAFARIGIDSVQLHGAVGYTWEYDVQLYLKRSKWARPMFGDAEHHYDRVAALGDA
jgi:alkylation response protein AidB-like acyl-CoA dehydrogenase